MVEYRKVLLVTSLKVSKAFLLNLLMDIGIRLSPYFLCSLDLLFSVLWWFVSQVLLTSLINKFFLTWGIKTWSICPKEIGKRVWVFTHKINLNPPFIFYFLFFVFLFSLEQTFKSFVDWLVLCNRLEHATIKYATGLSF